MVAVARLVTASVCLVDSVAGPPPGQPRRNPLAWISQAALVFTRPSGCGHAGAPAGTSAAGSTGLVKNDPVLQVSGSAPSSTIPLARRRSRTAAATSAAGAGSPTATPRRPASSAYRTVRVTVPVTRANATSRTTNRPGSALNRLVR